MTVYIRLEMLAIGLLADDWFYVKEQAPSVRYIPKADIRFAAIQFLFRTRMPNQCIRFR